MTPELLRALSVLPSFPRTATELVALIGIESASSLISAWPGQEFPVPLFAPGRRGNAHGERRYEQLMEVVGEHAARRIIAHWGGQPLFIPNCKAALWALAQDKIRADYDRLTVQNGYSHREAVFELGIANNISGRAIDKVLSRPDTVSAPAMEQLSLL